MKKLLGLLATIFLMATGMSCGESEHKSEKSLGNIHFAVSGHPDALPSFEKGLLLLHSFEYDDAAEAFAEARRIDKSFAMAYWGEAMTHNHPLWQQQDMVKGRKVLEALHPDAEQRVTLAQSAVEKDFIRGVNILYGSGDKQTRDSTYAAFMHSLYEKYPGNDEVTAFYSLALNAWGYATQNNDVLENAAQAGLEVMKRNPDHPGAIHYVIHAYDNPAFAEKGLKAADEYASVAPAAGHALHMPSHIYTALGMWDRVIESNIVSWAAEANRKNRKGLTNDAYGYHSYHWLQYGYLQKGNYKQAAEMVDSMQLYCNALPSERARIHMNYLQTSFLGETLDYLHPVANIKVNCKDLNVTNRAAAHFVKGMQAFQAKKISDLNAAINSLKAELLLEKANGDGAGLRVCGNISRAQATAVDVGTAEVMFMQLEAQAALLNNNDEIFEQKIKAAINMETALGNLPGPPIITIPPREMYGRWLLEQNRADEALTLFEQQLRLTPHRLHAQNGVDASKKVLAGISATGRKQSLAAR